MEFLTDFSAWIADFFTSDSEGSFFYRIQAYAALIIIQFQLAVIQNGWLVAKELLDILDVSSMFSDAFTNLPTSVLGVLSIFKIPEALNVIIQSYVARFVLTLI